MFYFTKKERERVLSLSMLRKLKAIARPAVKFFRAWQHRGDKVYCVVCGKSFESFAPHKNKRPNAKCWNCGALERHRLFWKYLNDKTNFRKWNKVNVLHFAPETIFYKIFSSIPNINYVPCDLFPQRYPFKSGPKSIRST